MNQGRVPGAVVTNPLLKTVEQEWLDKRQGKAAAIERERHDWGRYCRASGIGGFTSAAFTGISQRLE